MNPTVPAHSAPLVDPSRERFWLVALLIASALLSWSQRFVLDDAFISLRYARNLVEGHGLVWNVGERVEGYTNFSWTMLMAALLAAGIEPLSALELIGPVLSALTLWLTHRLACRVIGSGGIRALLPTALLGTHASFVAYATGGLETQLVALLTTASFVVALAPPPASIGRALSLSLLVALCAMTRLDSLLTLALALLAFIAASQPDARQRRLSLLLALLAPASVILSVWLSWKLWYYGDLLPNTFYAKQAPNSAWAQGATYLIDYFSCYGLWAPVLILFVGVWQTRTAPLATIHIVLGSLLLTWLYLCKVGGDFMEFRFMVHSAPLLFVALAWAFDRVVQSAAVRVGLIASLCLLSLRHALTYTNQDGIESISSLSSHLEAGKENWIGVGQALAGGLPPRSDVLIAVSAAGAIPYYSELPALDMLGLTDPWIAEHGAPTPMLQVSHTKAAPFGYLMAREVNLVLGHPWVHPPAPAELGAYPLESVFRLRYILALNPERFPREASMLEIPLADGQVVAVLYLRPHPDIDRAIAARRWRRFPIVAARK